MAQPFDREQEVRVRLAVTADLHWGTHAAGDAATRDRALAEAAKLPEARDGRVQSLERELRAAPAPGVSGP